MCLIHLLDQEIRTDIEVVRETIRRNEEEVEDHQDEHYTLEDVECRRVHPHRIAVKGKVKIVAKVSDYTSLYRDKTSRDYESEVLTDSTWNDLMPILFAQCNTTRDFVHIYLEGIQKRYRKEGITYCSLLLGS